MNVRTLIGQPVHRAEDLRFLKGAGTFIDDVTRERMLHAVVLRCGWGDVVGGAYLGVFFVDPTTHEGLWVLSSESWNDDE